MRIDRLTLTDFRCFAEYEISLSPRFTLLIGDNGSGKTALLDALKLVLKPVLDVLHGKPEVFYYEPIELDRRYKLTVKGQNPIKEDAGFPKLIAKGSFFQEPLDWQLHIPVDSNPFAYISNSVPYLNKEILPVLSYYGTDRLWRYQPEPVQTMSPFSRFIGYNKCLDSAFDLKQLFSWFKTQEIGALQKQERRHVLEAVRAAIVGMIPGATRAWWDVDWDELLIETGTQIVPFHLLSDGYRNMTGMAADIAYRMATLNPQLEADAVNLTAGVVLIDEIDLHLHPKWQRLVVERLLATFPKVQFVASTHSPFIIQSLYGRDDALLWDLDSAQPLQIDSKSIEDIAEHQQGVEIPQQSQRFLDMEQAAEAYYQILKQLPAADEPQKQALRQQLDALLLPYSDDPAFQAFLKLERLAVDGGDAAS